MIGLIFKHGWFQMQIFFYRYFIFDDDLVYFWSPNFTETYHSMIVFLMNFILKIVKIAWPLSL